MAGRLESKVAIVTGAGGGIGREHARLFAAEGAAVLVNDVGRRTGADAAAVATEIEAAGGTAVADAGSATWDGAGSIVQHAIDEFGRLDIVVNNATAARNADLWRVDRGGLGPGPRREPQGVLRDDPGSGPAPLRSGFGGDRQHELGVGVRASVGYRVPRRRRKAWWA